METANFEKIKETELYPFLDNDIKIGLAIYIHNEIEKRPVTLTFLKETFSEDLTFEEIVKGLNVLLAWEMIERTYEEVENGKVSMIYRLTDIGRNVFAKEYQDFSKKIKSPSIKPIPRS